MDRQYFWLNANPRYWCVHDTPVGEEEDYTLYNDEGNKRFIFHCFTDAKEGDIILAYQSTPNAYLLGIYRVTQPAGDPDDKDASLYISKIADIPNAITKKDLIAKGLKDCKPIKGNQGSLFPLEAEEYRAILDTIEEKNPGFLKTQNNQNLPLVDRIEQISFEEAVMYAKKQGTYYLGIDYPLHKVYSEAELKKDFQIAKLQTISLSKRDNTRILIDYIDGEAVGWKSQTEFFLTYDIVYSTEFNYKFDLGLDFGLDKYIFLLTETTPGMFRYDGIAELSIGGFKESRTEDGKYAYAVRVDGRLLQGEPEMIDTDKIKDIYGYVDPKKMEQLTSVYYRSPEVAEYARRTANGICQLCGKPAPFKDKSGRPFLESHHVIWLSRGGTDTIDNVVGLCPNCHQRMHVLDDPIDIGKLLLVIEKREERK